MNKLEKFLRDNYIQGEVKKNNSYTLMQKNSEGELIEIKLDRTISSSMQKIKGIFDLTKEAVDRRRMFHLFDSKKELKFCPEPTVFFDVGEKVIYGNHSDCHIEEILFGSMAYVVRMKNGIQIVLWWSIEKWHSIGCKSLWISDEEDVFVSYDTMRILSLIHDMFFFGVEMNPHYQRGNVWEYGDKLSLIDSIFKNNDIGKFCFNRRDYGSDKLFEIIDGKQRLTAISEFVTNKYKYKGLYWFELNPGDRDRFMNKTFQLATLQESNEKRIYQYFLKMNTTGKRQDPGHIDYVKKLLGELK